MTIFDMGGSFCSGSYVPSTTFVDGVINEALVQQNDIDHTFDEISNSWMLFNNKQRAILKNYLAYLTSNITEATEVSDQGEKLKIGYYIKPLEFFYLEETRDDIEEVISKEDLNFEFFYLKTELETFLIYIKDYYHILGGTSFLPLMTTLFVTYNLKSLKQDRIFYVLTGNGTNYLRTFKNLNYLDDFGHSRILPNNSEDLLGDSCYDLTNILSSRLRVVNTFGFKSKVLTLFFPYPDKIEFLGLISNIYGKLRLLEELIQNHSSLLYDDKNSDRNIVYMEEDDFKEPKGALEYLEWLMVIFDYYQYETINIQNYLYSEKTTNNTLNSFLYSLELQVRQIYLMTIKKI